LLVETHFVLYPSSHRCFVETLADIVVCLALWVGKHVGAPQASWMAAQGRAEGLTERDST
jgi:hypothetical protein